jgi:hypothetical protein
LGGSRLTISRGLSCDLLGLGTGRLDTPLSIVFGGLEPTLRSLFGSPLRFCKTPFGRDLGLLLGFFGQALRDRLSLFDAALGLFIGLELGRCDALIGCALKLSDFDGRGLAFTLNFS